MSESITHRINKILDPEHKLSRQHIKTLEEWAARRGLPLDIAAAIALEMQALEQLSKIAEDLDFTDAAKAHAAARIIAGINWEDEGAKVITQFEIEELTQTQERPENGHSGE